MKHIRRTKKGLVEKKTGRLIESPLKPMVRKRRSIDTVTAEIVLVLRPMECLGQDDRIVAIFAKLVKQGKISFWEACEKALQRIYTVRQKQGYF